jgi:hypothetical protein
MGCQEYVEHKRASTGHVEDEEVMGYELPRRIWKGQQVNTRMVKIRKSWGTSYHDGCGDKEELVRTRLKP